jgi:dephospho-CoA kinase
MKRVILLHGNPANGKSTLAKRLKDQHEFHAISVDHVYVNFH